MRKAFICVMVGLALAALISGVVLAQTEAPGLEEMTSDGVKYVSGGYGLEEREALLAMAKDYNLKLEFIMRLGPYASDAMVTIEDAKGKSLLQTGSDGPWFFAKLPPGRYTVTATLDDRKEVQKVSVGKGLRVIIFRW